MAPPKNPPKKSSRKTKDDTLSQLPASDMEHLRCIALKLLNKIEEQIDCPQDAGEVAGLSERLFGQKTSLVDTLLKLADLLSVLSAHANDTQAATVQEQEQKPAQPDSFDMSVMQAFIDRVRKLHAAEETRS